MKYFFDCEFIEGFKKPISWLPTIGNFNKPYHSIQLISIGIYCEDGREYYAISNEFNPKDASDWVKENVLSKLPKRFVDATVGGDSPRIVAESMAWKSNKRIANEIIDFCKPRREFEIQPPITLKYSELKAPQFYAYYADYDWVLFCSLFGTMVDLPKGFPMYCIDLKQTMDEIVLKKRGMGSIAEDFNVKLEMVKCSPSYPKQQNEHNALDDAKWNYELYKFIQTI